MLRAVYLKAQIENFVLQVPELKAKEGEILCLIGRSGAGKTSLLHCLCGFIPIQQGSIHFGETDLSEFPPEKRRMAMVFQRGALFPHLSAIKNILFGLECQALTKIEREERAQHWMERLGVSSLRDRLPTSMSVGQCQKVAFARALAVEFPVLLLDEPFSALDPVSRTEIRDLLKATVKERKLSAILVTHSPDDVESLGDQVLCLGEGKVLWGGKPTHLDLKNAKVRESMFGSIE